MVLFDGAMGTYYSSLSNTKLPDCEMANIFDQKTILNIHKEYIEAGARAIKTNTFSANRPSLNCDEVILERVIAEGVQIAKKAVNGKEVQIFADIGPIQEGSYDDYLEIIEIFLKNGVNNFLFETFSVDTHLEEISAKIKAIDPKSFVMISFAVAPDGFTRAGVKIQDLFNKFEQIKTVDCIGINCISGPYHLLQLVKKLRLPQKKLSIMPNAGYPTVINNRTFFSNNSAYFANLLIEFIDYGFDYLGGCCGTTPEYIEQVHELLKNKTTPEVHVQRDTTLRLRSEPTENLFYEKLAKRKKIIAVEYSPPTTIDIKKYMEQAKIIRNAGADAITIADCPVGRARIDSSLMAYKLKNEIGVEPIVHMTCRDRNINAIKALLLGLNIENILNLILVTGDPIPTEQRKEIKAVFDFNSVLLTKYIKNLNEDLFTNPMNLGAALNLNSPKFHLELKKAQKKEEAGTQMFFTQPIHSNEAIENLKRAKDQLNAKIITGIMPIVSYRNAYYMQNEISGFQIQEDLLSRYQEASKEDYNKLAIEYAINFCDRVKPLNDGYYLVTPFNRVDLIEKIIQHIKE